MKASSAAIPTLTEYLERIGRVSRAEGLDAFLDATRRNLERMTPKDQRLAVLLRALRIISVATIEFASHEVEQGVEIEEILPSLARAMGWAVASALASTSDTDKPPPRSFARLFAEEFRQGALAMIDSYVSQEGAAT